MFNVVPSEQVTARAELKTTNRFLRRRTCKNGLASCCICGFMWDWLDSTLIASFSFEIMFFISFEAFQDIRPIIWGS